MHSGAMPERESEIPNGDVSAYFRGEQSPIGPLVSRKSTDKPAAGDALWGGIWLSLISARLVRAMEVEGITGWATFPVRLLLKSGEPDPSEWFGLAVTGRCGELDWSGARIEVRQMAPEGPATRMRRGPWVPEKGWDGSDLALPGATMHTLCTERFRTAMKRHNIRRLEFQPLAEMWDPNLEEADAESQDG